jgi:hypothetical protein
MKGNDALLSSCSDMSERCPSTHLFHHNRTISALVVVAAQQIA